MLIKPINPNRIVEIDTIFDVRALVNGDTSLRFFLPKPDADVTNNNYEDNPLPGLSGHHVLGLGLECLLPIIEQDAANGVNVQKIANALAQGVLELTTNGDRERVGAWPLSTFLDLKNLDYQQEIDTDYDVAGASQKTVETELVQIKSFGLRDIPDPFLLSPSIPFRLIMRFRSGTAWPTAQNWTDSAQGGSLQFKAKLQYGRIADE